MSDQAQAFSYLFRVRYAECDAQNVVFNARYADYVDLAATEFLRAIGMDYRDVLAAGLDNQVVKLELQWRAPARFDDVLCARVSLASLGNTSYTLATRFLIHDTQAEVASSEAVYVMVNREDWSKTPVPDWLRERLSEGAKGRLVDHAGLTTGTVRDEDAVN